MNLSINISVCILYLTTLLLVWCAIFYKSSIRSIALCVISLIAAFHSCNILNDKNLGLEFAITSFLCIILIEGYLIFGKKRGYEKFCILSFLFVLIIVIILNFKLLWSTIVPIFVLPIFLLMGITGSH